MERSLVQVKPREALGGQFSGLRKGRYRESGDREARSGRSAACPGHAVIECVRRLRLDEGIAWKSLFIENDGSGVVFLPGRRSSRQGDPRWGRGLADVGENARHRGGLGGEGDDPNVAAAVGTGQ
jgi:hypothetical protein